MLKTLHFNNDVVVEVYNRDKRLYDFNVYTDTNQENVAPDVDAYFNLYEKADVWSIGFCDRKEIMQVLRKVKEITNEIN